MLFKRTIPAVAKTLAAFGIVAATPALSGCVAALLPIAAAGAYGGSRLAGQDLDKRAAPVTRSALSQNSIADGDRLELQDLAALPAPEPGDANGPLSPALPDDARNSTDYMIALLAEAGLRQRNGVIGDSVVLMPDTDPASPQVTLCDGLPYALLVSLDAPARMAPSQPIAPALQDAVEAARDAGIAVLYASDRLADEAGERAVEQALNSRNLGPAIRGKNLYFVGDRGSFDSDSLRWKIASNYCVIAMMGDAPTDFSLIYSRYADDILRTSTIGSLWNAGWFLSPEPLAISPQTGQSPDQNAGRPASADIGEQQ